MVSPEFPTWAPTSMPAELYVEGYALSEAVRDVTLTLSYVQNGTQVVASDTVTLTVITIGLKQVSFSGDPDEEAQAEEPSSYDVRTDDDTASYSGVPQWQDNTSPLDGDADDGVEFEQGADRKWPVCFQRAKKMVVEVLMHILPAPFFGTVKMKGEGTGFTFPETEADKDPGQATGTWTSTLPNHVARYDPLLINWYLSHDNGASWFGPFASANEFFVMLGNPLGDPTANPPVPGCQTPFRTVLYLATEGSTATSESQCVTDTWANFSSRNVCAWDATTMDYTRALRYYENHTGNGNTQAYQLLRDANGQCGSWADLFMECLRANNVADLHATLVLPPASDYQPAPQYGSFAVKNMGFDDTDPMYPDDGDDGNAPWYYGIDHSQDDQDGRETDDLDIRAAGVPGQNMATPYAKIFGLHYIVHRTGDATYYDPSYGLTASGAGDYTSQAVDAWGALYWNPERAANENPQVQWRRRTSSPALDLRLLDQ